MYATVYLKLNQDADDNRTDHHSVILSDAQSETQSPVPAQDVLANTVVGVIYDDSKCSSIQGAPGT